MVIFRRKPPGPLDPRRGLLCAYCVEAYLSWQSSPVVGQETPTVNVALTILPSGKNEPGAGAAACLAHLRSLLRAREILERQRHAQQDGPASGHLPSFEKGQPHGHAMPRMAPA